MKSLFLHGYGFSIKVKNTKLVFSQGITPFNNSRDVLVLPSSNCPFDKVVIQGRGYVSTEALERLSESNINVIMLDKRGKLYSHFHKIGGHEPLIRQNQYDAFRDPRKLEFLRKWLVSQKIESQLNLFKEFLAEPKQVFNSYNKKWQICNNQRSAMNYSLRIKPEIKEKIRNVILLMEGRFQNLESAHELREIMRVEGDIAKLYYPTLSLLFRPDLGFHSRNNVRTFRPKDASDVINGLLNYGFGILYAEVAKQLNILGLDCYVSFYHRNHESHLALVYDMIEPFRHLIDRSIFEIQDHIRRKDYIFSREGIVVLSNELKKKHIDLLSTILDRKRQYKPISGIRRKNGFQNMEGYPIIFCSKGKGSYLDRITILSNGQAEDDNSRTSLLLLKGSIP